MCREYDSGSWSFKNPTQEDAPSLSLLLILILFCDSMQLTGWPLHQNFQNKMRGNLTVLPMTNIIVSWVENFATQCCFLEIHDLVYHQRQQTDSDVHDQNYA